MRCSSIFAMSILFATSAVAQINESSSLPEIEFSQLSQRDPNPLGEKSTRDSPGAMETRQDRSFHLSFRSQLRRYARVSGSGVSLPRHRERTGA